jgi:hypothetical protein
VAEGNKALIDWDKVDELLLAGCLATEIAGQLGICRETLYNRCKTDKNLDYSTYSQQKKAKGDSLLRVVQFKNAMEGNTTMQVWLGKQRLDQREKNDISASIIVNTINYADADDKSTDVDPSL